MVPETYQELQKVSHFIHLFWNYWKQDFLIKQVSLHI